jgi:hypothetical protein
MKISSFNSPLVAALVLAGVSFSLTPLSSRAQSDVIAGSATLQPQVSFSPGIRDVLKMLDAKVDIEVVKAYVKNSQIAFNPTASDIIELKRRNVPDDVITSLMQRGAEVRAQLAQSASQMPPPASAPQTPPYGYDYSATNPYYTNPAYPDYASAYPAYDYPYYDYGYPYAYGYGYSYPWSFYSPFYFGFSGHRFGDFDRFHHFDRFDRFHGGRSFAFQGRPGFGGRGAWAPASGGFGHRGFATAGFAGRSFASGGGFRSGDFVGRSGGFGGHSGGFGGHLTGGGGFGGHGGGGHSGGGHR